MFKHLYTYGILPICSSTFWLRAPYYNAHVIFINDLMNIMISNFIFRKNLVKQFLPKLIIQMPHIRFIDIISQSVSMNHFFLPYINPCKVERLVHHEY